MDNEGSKAEDNNGGGKGERAKRGKLFALSWFLFTHFIIPPFCFSVSPFTQLSVSPFGETPLASPQQSSL